MASFRRHFMTILDRREELGKGKSKRTDTLREVPLGRFQYFLCKTAGVPDEPLSEREKDRHASESTSKRTPPVQKFREDPIRHGYLATRLHHHRYIGRRREGHRRTYRRSSRVYDHIVGGPPPPMSAGMADRLRIRRPVRRLDRKASQKHRGGCHPHPCARIRSDALAQTPSLRGWAP
jgi:hypothetical protein